MNIKSIAYILLFSGLTSLFLGQEKPSQPVNETIDKLASKLPRLKASTPAESLEQIEIHSDFELQLVASEPLIRDPGAIAIDESNRMYVCELPEYNAYAANEDPALNSLNFFVSGLPKLYNTEIPATSKRNATIHFTP